MAISAGAPTVLLHEQRELDGWFYAGVLVIVATVFAHPLLHRKQRLTKLPQLLGTAESHGMVD